MADSLDPNWFYSSLAQSAASVVGLLGAILSTRIQGQIERAAEQHVEATRSLQQLNDVARPLAERLALYVERSPSQIEALRTAIAGNTGSMTPAEWHSPFDMGAKNVHVEASPHILEVETARLNLARSVAPHLQALLEATTPEQLDSFCPSVELLMVDDSAEGMPPILRKVTSQAGKAADHLRILGIRTEVRLPVALCSCLLVLSVAGIVVPLSFLSAYTDTHRTVLTALFGGALGSFLLYLASQISRLKRLGWYRTLLPPRPWNDCGA